MTDDIVDRLRNGYALDYDQNELFKFCNEAADEIERLRERRDDWRAAMTENHDLWNENERLRAALREIANGPRDADKSYVSLLHEIQSEARAALEGEKKDD
jgi:regulator of replication initiation timing